MSRRDEVGWFSRVLVPVDLDEADARAVVHAVRLAVEQAGSVHLVHVRPPIGPDTDWSALPSPRELLVQWDRIAPDGEVIDARIRTERLSVPGLDLVDAMVRAVEEVLPDLVVLDTEGRHGLARLREESVAEAIARGISMPTLFLPRRARGFVDASTGSISLRRVLVPVDDKEDAQRAVDVAMRFVECFGGTPTTFVLVHIGDRDGVPQVLAPADDPR
jgi:nucleotide-binding universal stress UspA family protein